MNRGINFRETIKFAGTYISVCIGSGFATGQEIMQFFSAQGMISILSSLICMVILAYCGGSLLEIGKESRLRSNNEIYTYLCGNHIGAFFKFFMPIFFFLSFVIMIAGAGASINQYYGLDKLMGSLILAIISLISVLMGMNKLIDILGNIGPMIVIISVGIGIVSISRNFEYIDSINETISSLNVTKAVDNWFLSGIIYAGLNLIIATPFLTGVGSTAKNRNSCIYGGIIGGVTFMVAAIALNIGIMLDIQDVYMTEIPTLFMANEIGPIVGIMFSLMLIAGIYTTAVPLLWGVCTSFAKEKTKGFTYIAVFCCAIGFILSKIPFTKLVNLIYPLSGLFGVVIILGIIIKKFKLNK